MKNNEDNPLTNIPNSNTPFRPNLSVKAPPIADPTIIPTEKREKMYPTSTIVIPAYLSIKYRLKKGQSILPPSPSMKVANISTQNGREYLLKFCFTLLNIELFP